VACKDGRILAVGDESTINEFKGKNTEIIDIEGGTMLPGFIDICGHPVLQAFAKACLILYDDMSEKMVLETLSDYIKINPDKHAYFAYGFNTSFVTGRDTKELQETLNEICADKPVVLLDISGIEGWFNTKALDVVRASVAEEEQMPIITLPYILHVLSPIDFEQLQEAIVDLSAEYCEKGYTTIFDCGAPDYLHAIYQEIVIELLQAEMLKQRFLGSFFVIRNVNPDYVGKKLMQKKTACSETEEYVNCNVLKLVLDGARAAEPGGMKITFDSLKAFIAEAVDKGFNVHIDAIEKSDVVDAFEAIFLRKTSGNKKSYFTIAHPHEFTEEERMELLLDNDTCETDFTLGDFKRKYTSLKGVENTFDAVDKLTIDAASHIGISEDFGSIDIDKHADFVVFDDAITKI
jgi:predicted amidohydrolase YtcJ